MYTLSFRIEFMRDVILTLYVYKTCIYAFIHTYIHTYIHYCAKVLGTSEEKLV